MRDVPGLVARRGTPAFAFFVVRLAEPVDRDELAALVRHLAPLIPDAEEFAAELPAELDERVQILAIPWAPPDVDGLDAQRRVLDGAPGVTAAWCFQTEADDADDTGGWDDDERTAPIELVGLRWPVDGYPEIVDELDGELGIALKLRGEPLAGEGTVLLAFHTLWLAPYGGRHRNASVTFDRRHHAAHLWVDRFTPACSAEQQIRDLLAIVAKLDEVVPVVHARFAGPSMAQSYGADEPFVLGGNPLLALDEPELDEWIATQTEWSPEEVAHMLRELAIELVTTTGDDEPAAADPARSITRYAGELLRARAEAGKLDPRAGERLLAVVDGRREIVEVLGALRFAPAVPAMIGMLDGELVAPAAAALGAIGDPSAIPALTRAVTAGAASSRPVAADALAACLAATPEPRTVDSAVLDALLAITRDVEDPDRVVLAHFAYGRIARQLAPDRRAEARDRLDELAPPVPSTVAMLARQAALVLASAPPPPDLGRLLHDQLTDVAFDHAARLRQVRVALQVAEVVPELVAVADLIELARFAEPDVRARAHLVLAKLGDPTLPARVIDRAAARGLGDDELVELIAEPHLIGRAALIVEAGRRGLVAARPSIVDACHDAVSRARPASANLTDADTQIFAAAVPVLRTPPLEAGAVALFERMLRHSNYHVKWALLEHPPDDERLSGGMRHVLGERWGWQEKVARQWLARFPDAPDEQDVN